MSVFVFAALEATFAMWTERTFGWGVAQNGYIFAYTGYSQRYRSRNHCRSHVEEMG